MIFLLVHIGWAQLSDYPALQRIRQVTHMTEFHWWVSQGENIQDGLRHNVWQWMRAVFWRALHFHLVSHSVGRFSPCCFLHRITQTSLCGSWLARCQTQELHCIVRTSFRSHPCPFDNILLAKASHRAISVSKQVRWEEKSHLQRCVQDELSGPEWVNLIQMTITSITVGKNALEEVE